MKNLLFIAAAGLAAITMLSSPVRLQRDLAALHRRRQRRTRLRARFERAGRLRYLAVAGPRRLAAYPDVPAVAESGGPAGFEVIGWTAIAVPKGLPPATADKIRRDIEKALAEPDVRERYASFGYELFPTTPEQFNQYIRSESSRFSEVIKRAKVSPD